MLAFGEEELQALAAQEFLLHKAGDGDGGAKLGSVGGGTSLKLRSKAGLLLVKGKKRGDGGERLVGGGPKPDGDFVQVLHFHAEYFVCPQELFGTAHAEIIAKRTVCVRVLVGEDGLLCVVALLLGHLNPDAGGLCTDDERCHQRTDC